MRQKLGRILLGLSVLTAAILYLPADIYAAGSVSVTADKTDVGVSDTITVYIKTSEPEDPSVAPEISVTYDSDKLEVTDCNVDYGGGGGLLTITGTDAQITMKALAAGSASISAEAVIDDDGNNPATGSTSVVVGGNTAAVLSSDATLRALTVSPGSLSPAFTPQGTEYTIEVDDSVTDITVSGGVTNEKAQITAASGFKNLKSGTNEAVITVTAEDGSTMTYHFTITRGGTTDETDAEEAEPEQKGIVDFQPYVGKKRKPGTGCVSELNDHLFEGRYSPIWPDGTQHSRNVYAHTREECEEKLKVLIVKMKAEIAEAKRLTDLGEGDGRPPEGKK